MRRNPFKTVPAYLRKPYPYGGKRWPVLLLLPLFIALFLVIFQPFGLHGFRHEHKDLVLVGYGGLTFLVLVLNMYVLPWIFPGRFREDKWTILSEIIYLAWMILSIGIGNFLYSSVFLSSSGNSFYVLLAFIGYTFAIGFIPILVLIMVSHNIMLRKSLAGVGEISGLLDEPRKEEAQGESTLLILRNESGQDKLEVTRNRLAYIESEGNYIHACYLEDGKVHQRTLRTTLKNIEEQLGEASSFLHCHRAYIVNLHLVEKVEGNSQGYRLQLKYMDRQVPVSRKYTVDFNRAFRSISSR